MELCSVCNKKVKRSKAHFCQNCLRCSHSKCCGTEYKFLKDVWLCKLCRYDVFPFNDSEQNPEQTDNELSDFKTFFDQLNTVNSDNKSTSEVDDVTRINCKYYSCDEFVSIPSKSKSLSFFHVNISSLEKHFDELSSLFLRLQHNFDVIGISETRLNHVSSDNICLPGYAFLHTPSDSNAGGVGIYISNKHTFKPRPDISDILFSSKCLESIFVELVLKGRKNIIVGCIYKHPLMSLDDFNNYYLSPLLSKIDKEKKTVLLLGDFNVNLLKVKTDTTCANFLDLLGSYHILPFISLPTRITNQSSTLIDNIFVSPSSNSLLSGNLTVSLSDHLPQFIFFQNEFISNVNQKLGYYRKWTNFDEIKFREEFDQINWDEVLALEKEDPEFSFNTFLCKFDLLFDKHVPLTKQTKRQLRLKDKPWISKGILRSMEVRDNYLREFQNSSNPGIKLFLQFRYKFYRNRIVSLLRISKKLHYSNYFLQNSNNLKKIWKGVNEIISSNPSKSNPNITLEIGNSLSSDPGTVAQTFNDFFSSIADKLREKVPFSRHHFSEWLKLPNPQSFFISPVLPREIFLLISSFDKNKSTGPNSIPIIIFNCVLDSLSNILSKLINLSFSTGIFPSKIKEAKVIPIFKKGSPLKVENYRPISLLSNLDKIFEKVMYNRLSKFLTNCKTLYPLQFGFRSNHSTTNLLINCIEKIFKALDSGNFGCSVFIDLQKAFDTVDHHILFSKLRHYGIRGLALSWFKSFLSFRKQFVSISGSRSKSQYISHGVPQGSVLGPLLFLLYINDLHEAIPYSTVNLFADDTMLFKSDTSTKALTKKINIDLKCLTNWLNANKISVNSAKTELIIFRPKFKIIDHDIKIKIQGQRLFPSNAVKYLGVYIDQHLSWNDHIEFVSGKLRRANGALSKLRHFVSSEILACLYNAFFHSHLSFSSQIWGQRENLRTRRILTLQKRALRIITSSDFNAPSSPLFLQLRLLSFFDFIKLQNIILIHQALNSKLPSPLIELLDLQSVTLNARNNDRPSRAKPGLLRLPRVSTVSFGNHSIQYQSIQSWNVLQSYLPIEDISILSLNRLKYFAKFYFLSSYLN